MVIWTMCAHSGTLSLISWLFINQFEISNESWISKLMNGIICIPGDKELKNIDSKESSKS